MAREDYEFECGIERGEKQYYVLVIYDMMLGSKGFPITNYLSR